MLEITTEEVLGMKIDLLWNTFLIINEESEGKYDEIKTNVEEGINEKFPIYYIIQRWYSLYPSGKRAKIQGYPKMSITNFMKEIEAREQIMRKIILDELQSEEIVKPRT